MRLLPLPCAVDIRPFEPISVSVSHANAREYDDTLLVAIRAWMLPGGPRECVTDGRRRKVLNIVQYTHNFFSSDGCLKSDGLYLFHRSESCHDTSYTCSPKWMEGVRLSFLLREVPKSSLSIQVSHAQHCYVAATFF
jgi:hypothetical protein